MKWKLFSYYYYLKNLFLFLCSSHFDNMPVSKFLCNQQIPSTVLYKTDCIHFHVHKLSVHQSVWTDGVNHDSQMAWSNTESTVDTSIWNRLCWQCCITIPLWHVEASCESWPPHLIGRTLKTGDSSTVPIRGAKNETSWGSFSLWCLILLFH